MGSHKNNTSSIAWNVSPFASIMTNKAEQYWTVSGAEMFHSSVSVLCNLSRNDRAQVKSSLRAFSRGKFS